MIDLKKINVDYKSGEDYLWTGRKVDPSLGKQYWYQEIIRSDIRKHEKLNKSDIALIGYSCDEGVRRNYGRIGAKKGPENIRKHLAKIPVHFESHGVYDLGDLICIGEDMESCQKALSDIVMKLVSEEIFPIVIGGGHDMAFGHYMGIHKALQNRKKNKLGIINLDAHFDLRPIENKPNSGTPFFQINQELEKDGQSINYFALGIQNQSNTKELFEIAKELNVKVVSNTECTLNENKFIDLCAQLNQFFQTVDYLYLTIDLDGFSSAYVSGVSAPSPLGFDPLFAFEILKFILNSGKVISCDIAELNPDYDCDGTSANLASKLIDLIVCNHLKTKEQKILS